MVSKQANDSPIEEESRRCLLLVKAFPPYPLDCGSNILTWNLLRELSKEFDITLLTRRPAQGETARKELETVCRRVVFSDPPNLRGPVRRMF